MKYIYKIAISFFLITSVQISHAETGTEIRRLVTNECTGLPVIEYIYTHFDYACNYHDMAYSMSYKRRIDADNELLAIFKKECDSHQIVGTGGLVSCHVAAQEMYKGLRLFGESYYLVAQKDTRVQIESYVHSGLHANTSPMFDDRTYMGNFGHKKTDYWPAAFLDPTYANTLRHMYNASNKSHTNKHRDILLHIRDNTYKTDTIKWNAANTMAFLGGQLDVKQCDFYGYHWSSGAAINSPEGDGWVTDSYSCASEPVRWCAKNSIYVPQSSWSSNGCQATGGPGGNLN